MKTPTVQEIKNQILAKKVRYSSLDGLQSSSNSSIYNLWAYITAFVMWTLYKAVEFVIQEVDEKLEKQKNFRPLTYRNWALEYRHGHPLVEEGEKIGYSDAGYTAEEIEAALIVKRCAVIEIELNQRTILFVKVATEIGGELAQLNAAQQQGLVDYFKRIKPAGTKLQVFSDKADDLRLSVKFYYDPLVLTDSGARIDGTDNAPVQTAIRGYLKNLRFNGEFSIAELEDIVQSVPGCSDREAYIVNAQANFQTPANFTVINDVLIANSGYMSILDENLSIDFKAKTITI